MLPTGQRGLALKGSSANSPSECTSTSRISASCRACLQWYARLLLVAIWVLCQSVAMEGMQTHLKVVNVGGMMSGIKNTCVTLTRRTRCSSDAGAKYSFDSEYETNGWICVASGHPSQKHAGVMIMISKRITRAAEVKHEATVPGQQLTVRFPVGNGSWHVRYR